MPRKKANDLTIAHYKSLRCTMFSEEILRICNQLTGTNHDRYVLVHLCDALKVPKQARSNFSTVRAFIRKLRSIASKHVDIERHGIWEGQLVNHRGTVYFVKKIHDSGVVTLQPVHGGKSVSVHPLSARTSK